MISAEKTYIVPFFDEDEIERVDARPTEIPEGYSSEALPTTGERLFPVIDKEHAYPIIDRLMEALRNNEPPYDRDRTRLPQDPRHMPETLEYGSKDHAAFFFNVCYYMRGGIKSNDAVQRMAKMYDANPLLFDYKYVRDMTENEEMEALLNQEIQATLTSFGLGFQPTVAKQWIVNARRMEAFDDDPRNIFEGVTTYEESLELIQNKKKKGFFGFQEKMTSMIIYYLMYEGLIKPFNFPIPVDIHVMRVSISNRMIRFYDSNGQEVPVGTNLFTDETTAALRKLYLDYVEERGENPLLVCDAVWMLSESICGTNPGNVTLEPMGRDTRKGRSAYLTPQVVDIHNPGQQKAYAKSCGICPVEHTCERNVPGKLYIVLGKLIDRGERIRFPESVIQQHRNQPELSDRIEPLFDL